MLKFSLHDFHLTVIWMNLAEHSMRAFCINEASSLLLKSKLNLKLASVAVGSGANI